MHGNKKKVKKYEISMEIPLLHDTITKQIVLRKPLQPQSINSNKSYKDHWVSAASVGTEKETRQLAYKQMVNDSGRLFRRLRPAGQGHSQQGRPLRREAGFLAAIFQTVCAFY